MCPLLELAELLKNVVCFLHIHLQTEQILYNTIYIWKGLPNYTEKDVHNISSKITVGYLFALRDHL